MRVVWTGGRVIVVGLSLLAAVPLTIATADARPFHAGHGKSFGVRYTRYYGGAGGISCVPFARENSGIELAGNAGTWWNAADGVYERGARPEVGSVLNFRSNGRMRMGHVAVVTRVADARNIEIDHANWAGPGGGRGAISRNISVVDVSERNDWSAVRVELGHTGDYGSIYPTFGFIYDRPDKGVMVANNAVAPALSLSPAPRDLRPAAERFGLDEGEVAEASDEPAYHRGWHRFASGRHRGGKVVLAGRGHGGASVRVVHEVRSAAVSRKGRHGRA